MVPVRPGAVPVVEIVPVLVVEMVPTFVVEIVPGFANAVTDIVKAKIADEAINLEFFIALLLVN
jgi:hypothetical protein